MTYYLNFYLDESGNAISDFFVVGGFYLNDSEYQNIQISESKIKSNILKTEKSIRDYRNNFEKDLKAYDLKKEVKWNNLSLSNKKALSSKIRFNNQTNVAMISSLKNWNSKHSKEINLDAIYNMMVKNLIERTIKSISSKSVIKNQDILNIKVYIDQRKTMIKTNKRQKLETLEGYLKTSFFWELNFKEILVKVIQLESTSYPLIRYADYFVGSVASMCNFLNHSTRSWYQEADVVFEQMHKKVPCICNQAIIKQSNVIEQLVSFCQNHNHVREQKTNNVF
ncbi:DUF3800 domain-containing protein [Mycoplasma feriruminatoris]|uniref:DUF3800 domain-containing protein n=1 Tax=Mycoplasma feriruminatoris TaxID=1179777 RepID=A0AAQ3DLK5_9MOLU|nr:DUF3800 domain-containing protein [Mycoplasma feriruminatoris]WFQ92280.1 hypothetical protein MFERI14822_00035 [Mycoplasma feriruminatoris]WFQ94810.1 hypothetical protein MFERI15407_00035 [Mycoplasma feriruminatoris]